MKRIVLCITALLLLFASCDKGCKIKRPKDVKPIDWENYNDVYTVYWNCYFLCSEIKDRNMHNKIMIYGWIQNITNGSFSLVDTFNKISSISITMCCEELQTKLDTIDISKKYFVKGELLFILSNPTECCTTSPEIRVVDINDIYFK
jgi:hypothetical protein